MVTIDEIREQTRLDEEARKQKEASGNWLEKLKNAVLAGGAAYLTGGLANTLLGMLPGAAVPGVISEAGAVGKAAPTMGDVLKMGPEAAKALLAPTQASVIGAGKAAIEGYNAPDTQGAIEYGAKKGIGDVLARKEGEVERGIMAGMKLEPESAEEGKVKYKRRPQAPEFDTGQLGPAPSGYAWSKKAVYDTKTGTSAIIPMLVKLPAGVKSLGGKGGGGSKPILSDFAKSIEIGMAGKTPTSEDIKWFKETDKLTDDEKRYFLNKYTGAPKVTGD